MCLITFAYQQHSQYPFILIANRDEFFARPGKQMHYWNDQKNILAGRDLEKMGTWLGFNTNGRFAAVTNFRKKLNINTDSNDHQLSSRGELVTQSLLSDLSATQFLDKQSLIADQFTAYNLLSADQFGLYFSNNHQNQHVKKLSKGLYGLCNASLDTPWPKLLDAKQQLANLIDSNQVSMANLKGLLNDTSTAEDHLLPDTGIAKEWEKTLSSQFINIEKYGTRAKTIILQRNDGKTLIHEIRYDHSGFIGESSFELDLTVIGSSSTAN